MKTHSAQLRLAVVSLEVFAGREVGFLCVYMCVVSVSCGPIFQEVSSNFSFHIIPASLYHMPNPIGSQSEEPCLSFPEFFLLVLVVHSPPALLPHSKSSIPGGCIKSLLFHPWLKQDL